MLTVTPAAKRQLKIDLDKDLNNKGGLARVVYSPSNPGKIAFKVDKERKGDQVILDNQGEELLLIGADMVSELDDMILDYGQKDDKREFIITKFR